jgi:hypothetical protein
LAENDRRIAASVTNPNEGAAIPLEPDQKKSLHAQQVAAGMLPADSPPDFVIPESGLNADGLPWWFPPGFKAFEVTIDGEPAQPLDAQGWYTGVNSESTRDRTTTRHRNDSNTTPAGVPIHHDLDYFDHEHPELVTRESIEKEFSYRVTTLSKPSPVTPPKRIWSEAQMTRIRLGYEAQVMEEKWHGFMEGNKLTLLRSWTGFCVFEANFVQVPKGWMLADPVMESDLDFYLRRSDKYESTYLELIIVGTLLGKFDKKLEARWFREMHKVDAGPKLVVTNRQGPQFRIEPPGNSAKHGKLADQHPLQREEYDKFLAKGFTAALDAIAKKGMNPQDIYYSADQQEALALSTVAIESSQHAGLAKGAKMAAYKYSREVSEAVASEAPKGAGWTVITDHSDAGLSAALNGLSSDQWTEIGSIADLMTVSDQLTLLSKQPDPARAVEQFVRFWYDHGLVIDFPWMSWPRFGKGIEVGHPATIKKLLHASAEDALRLATKLLRAENFDEGSLVRAVDSCLLGAVLDRLLRWPLPTGTGQNW